MAYLIVKKDNGEQLFDTNLICYGLVKSGYMTYQQTWTRRQLRSVQLDPNDGANWTPVNVLVDPSKKTDSLHGFTVENAVSPVVFIVGPGAANGAKVTGTSITFYFACASTSTKFYCFDLMSDNIPGGPFLKIWKDTGQLTFNSLQPPLNVVNAINAPPLGPRGGPNRPEDWRDPAYAGGYNVSLNAGNSQGDFSRILSRVDLPLSAGKEYAAYLPWSRSCGINDPSPNLGYEAYSQHGGVEGAFGRVGGISFMFCSAAGTTEQFNPVYGSPSFFGIPTDRAPTALVIETANLPFPYN